MKIDESRCGYCGEHCEDGDCITIKCPDRTIRFCDDKCRQDFIKWYNFLKTAWEKCGERNIKNNEKKDCKNCHQQHYSQDIYLPRPVLKDDILDDYMFSNKDTSFGDDLDIAKFYKRCKDYYLNNKKELSLSYTLRFCENDRLEREKKYNSKKGTDDIEKSIMKSELPEEGKQELLRFFKTYYGTFNLNEIRRTTYDFYFGSIAKDDRWLFFFCFEAFGYSANDFIDWSTLRTMQIGRSLAQAEVKKRQAEVKKQQSKKILMKIFFWLLAIFIVLIALAVLGSLGE
ncbi:MAG: hypothetical protein IKS20_10365 [Victivallales bacterium]|nr:hypothetical protein [Victivallales bacterium]